MRIATSTTLFAEGSPEFLETWNERRRSVHRAIDAVRWPPGAADFAIRPELRSNGVVPIRLAFAQAMRVEPAWSQERVTIRHVFGGPIELGPIDFEHASPDDLTLVEWETGNVASAHRAVNKIALRLKERSAAYAFLVLPTRNLGRYLTDRVSSFEEITPYFDLWRGFNLSRAAFEIIGVEQDRSDDDAPFIPKVKAGRRATD